jgi:hypothetical protein
LSQVDKASAVGIVQWRKDVGLNFLHDRLQRCENFVSFGRE